MKIQDLQVVITGASGGIGKWVARILSNNGARIIAIGRNQEQLHNVVSALTPHPKYPHLYYCCDINNSEDREKLTNNLQQLDPKPNYLINLAGTGGLTLFEKEAEKNIIDTINLNVTSTILLTQQLIPILAANHHAGIINVGSILGSIGYPGYATYCASKFAIRGFTEALQRELSDTNIDVKYFAPRATQTDFITRHERCLNKALKNHEDDPCLVAEQLVDLIKSNQSRLFVGWPEKFFVWLNSIAPALVGNSIKKQLTTIKHFATLSH